MSKFSIIPRFWKKHREVVSSGLGFMTGWTQLESTSKIIIINVENSSFGYDLTTGNLVKRGLYHCCVGTLWFSNYAPWRRVLRTMWPFSGHILVFKLCPLEERASHHSFCWGGLETKREIATTNSTNTSTTTFMNQHGIAILTVAAHHFLCNVIMGNTNKLESVVMPMSW